MWLRITNPDILIFLDVSYKQTIKRGMPQWSEADYDEEQHRLRHAREHADLYIDTDQSPEAETLNTALDFLRMGDVEKGDQ
ncbi:MAG: hypothetical protein OEZ02_09765 [Anaerolineae bacterium]|nr:hypothetical protein [Anaerolineae bacterium]